MGTDYTGTGFQGYRVSEFQGFKVSGFQGFRVSELLELNAEPVTLKP
jgi:hypothetical protein